MTDEPEAYPPCRCGREMRKLNAASDTPKCVGCGYTEELCRCQPRTVLVSCWSCSAAFGRLGDEGQAALIDAHYQDCTAYLGGEGLKKEQPIAYAFEDAHA